jgi:hypothetical protein
VKVQVADAKARAAELLVERAERLERHVLKNEKLTNRALLCARLAVCGAENKRAARPGASSGRRRAAFLEEMTVTEPGC